MNTAAKTSFTHELNRIPKIRTNKPILIAQLSLFDIVPIISPRMVRDGSFSDVPGAGISCQLAPRPSRTTGMVFSRIFKSSVGDQLSMYSMSSSIQRRKFN